MFGLLRFWSFGYCVGIEPGEGVWVSEGGSFGIFGFAIYGSFGILCYKCGLKGGGCPRARVVEVFGGLEVLLFVVLALRFGGFAVGISVTSFRVKELVVGGLWSGFVILRRFWVVFDCATKFCFAGIWMRA